MENQQVPNMELPQPVSHPDGLNLETSSPAPEKAATQERPSAPPSSIASQGAQPASAPAIALPNDASTDLSQHPIASNNPAIADDVDLIEKEWVKKAIEIVERTKTDPYVQNKEMNVFKADYMKKRYNKDMKLLQE